MMSNVKFQSYLLIASLCYLCVLGQLYCTSPSQREQAHTEEEVTAKNTYSTSNDEHKGDGNVYAGPEQVILVLTEDWDKVQGKLFTYQLKEGQWEQSSQPNPIVVGKNGMGWGSGLELVPMLGELTGPVKKEGDLKSPAGVFNLGNAFGYADKSSVPDIRLPYIHVNAYTQCIEDVESSYYNQIVAEHAVNKDWNSTDHMLRKDDLYEWGVEVAHNYDKPKPGGGSCIFLHVWRNASSGTAGCTAMEKKEMKTLLNWLNPQLNPILIQVPFAFYEPLRDFYGLPAVSWP